MGTLGVIEDEPLPKSSRSCKAESKDRKYRYWYLSVHHSRSMKILSCTRPRPSMLTAMPWASRTEVKSLAGELSPLVCVEDLRGAVARDSLLQGSDAKLGIQGVG